MEEKITEIMEKKTDQTTTEKVITPQNIEKKKKIRWGRISIILGLVALIILFIPFGSKSLGQMILSSITGSVIGSNNIAAKIDNQQITVKELYQEYNALNSDLKSTYTKNSLLEELIQEKLIMLEAKKQGLTVTDQEFSETIIQLEQNLISQGYTLKQVAELKGLTLTDFENKIRDQMLIKKYLDQVIYVKNIGETEARQFYNTNLDNLKTKEMVNVSHILVKNESDAQQILNKLKNGASFEQLASEYSIDIGTKVRGGNLGFFPKGVMVKEFEDAAFGIENVGDISDVIQTQFGYHILKLYGKKAAETPQFEDIKDQIIQSLQQSENSQELLKYRTNLFSIALSEGRVKILYKETN